MLDLEFFLDEGPEIVAMYKTHIFTKAKDVYGKTFRGYSTRGSKWVTMNVKKEHKKDAPKKGYSYKQAKEGNMLKRQRSKYANSTAPVASGDLLLDYGMIGSPKSTGFQLGWNIHGAKVEWLSDMGRVLTSSKQPLPRGVERYLDKQSSRYIKKKLGPDKTTRHKIGK